jgi:hypothetical protein
VGGELSTPIWTVTVDGEPYVRSGLGEDAKWYRRALQATTLRILAPDLTR